VRKQNLDLATLNAHKIHGPKGIGVLYIRKGVKIKAIQEGGGQEREIRGGTENVPGIVGMAKAVEIYDKEEIEKMKELRDKMIKELERIPEIKLNGSREKRLYNNINVRFAGIEGESILMMLDKEGICVSTGSACSSKSLEPSHVLLALGLKPEESHGSIRISLGRFNTEKEINKFLKVIPKIVKDLRKISPFWKE
jgi:cysteine desulfurase